MSQIIVVVLFQFMRYIFYVSLNKNNIFIQQICNIAINILFQSHTFLFLFILNKNSFEIFQRFFRNYQILYLNKLFHIN